MSSEEAPHTRQGPRELDHRSDVSRHALKHGLTAKKHVTLDSEDPEAYEALRTDVHRELDPHGALEAAFADQAAACLWRLDRAVRIESAAMDQAFQDTLEAGKDIYTPAQRFRRALTAAINNNWVGSVTGYQRDIQRLLFGYLDRLAALQSSRAVKFPVTPTNLRISLTLNQTDA